MSVRTNLLLPDDLVERLDRVAGPRGRSRYVADAVRARIDRDERVAAVRAAAGAWRGHPSFPTSDAVGAWVRAGRGEETSRVDAGDA
ncbi:MAG TPA: antitoxin [Candidatus Limnocylindria bacterium]|nr:antitoxin [Candidatus Limnocylindria bacterium]